MSAAAHKSMRALAAVLSVLVLFVAAGVACCAELR
jgi:hypothetical protein